MSRKVMESLDALHAQLRRFAMATPEAKALNDLDHLLHGGVLRAPPLLGADAAAHQAKLGEINAHYQELRDLLQKRADQTVAARALVMFDGMLTNLKQELS